MKSVNDEKTKEKNLNALGPNYGAISSLNNQSNNQSCNLLTLNQNTLDIYLPKSEINNHINQLQDLAELREIRDKSKMIMNVSQTRINNLVIISNNNNNNNNISK